MKGVADDGVRCACGRRTSAAKATCEAYPSCLAKEGGVVDLERLAQAMNWYDNDDPGIFNDIAIDETAARRIIPGLIARYNALDGEPL